MGRCRDSSHAACDVPNGSLNAAVFCLSSSFAPGYESFFQDRHWSTAIVDRAFYLAGIRQLSCSVYTLQDRSGSLDNQDRWM